MHISLSLISFVFYAFIFLSLFGCVLLPSLLSLNTMYLLEHNQPALSVRQLSPRAAFTAQFMERVLAFWRFAGFCFVSVCRLGGRRYLCSDSQARPNRNMNLYHFLVVFHSLLLCFFCTGKFLEHNIIYSWELCAKKDATNQSTSRRIGANRGNQQKGIGRGIGGVRGSIGNLGVWESRRAGERARHETQIQDDS